MKSRAADVVMSFNECISRRDLGGLSNLMTDDHVFIDSGNNTIAGKERCVEAWRAFFATFPPNAGVQFYADDWKWGPNDKYRWREHEGRGYWGPEGVWIEF